MRKLTVEIDLDKLPHGNLHAVFDAVVDAFYDDDTRTAREGQLCFNNGYVGDWSVVVEPRIKDVYAVGKSSTSA